MHFDNCIIRHNYARNKTRALLESVLTGDSGTAGAVGQTSQCAVSNCGNEFEESSSVSCRGSTLEYNQRELTSTSVIVANTASYSDKDGA